MASPALRVSGLLVCDGMGVVEVPTHIYLQLTNLDEVTWSEDQIYDNDLEYVIVPLNKTSGAEKKR